MYMMYVAPPTGPGEPELSPGGGQSSVVDADPGFTHPESGSAYYHSGEQGSLRRGGETLPVSVREPGW